MAAKRFGLKWRMHTCHIRTGHLVFFFECYKFVKVSACPTRMARGVCTWSGSDLRPSPKSSQQRPLAVVEKKCDGISHRCQIELECQYWKLKHFDLLKHVDLPGVKFDFTGLAKIQGVDPAKTKGSNAKTPNHHYDPNGFQAKRMSAVKLGGFCHIPKII